MARTRRRGAGCLVAVLIVLALLVAAVWAGGNTVGRSMITDRVATQLQQQLNLDEKPTVTLEDKLVAWSLLRQRFDAATVHIERLPLQVQQQTLTAAVDVRLDSIATSENYQRLVAHSLDGTARVNWDQLSSIVGYPTRDAGDGKIAFDYATNLLGQRVQATVTVRPTIEETGRTLTMTEPAVTIAGLQLPSSVVNTIAQSVVRPVPLGLPSALRATEIRTGADGATLDVTGTDVELTNLR